MKWFYFLMSYLVKRMGGAKNQEASLIDELKELVKENAVKIFLVLTAATALGSFLVAGICITAVELATQYSAGERYSFNGIVATGVVIFALTLTAFMGAFLFSTKHDREKRKMEARRAMYPKVNTLHDAVLLLVNDYIAEREYKRHLHQGTRKEREERREEHSVH